MNCVLHVKDMQLLMMLIDRCVIIILISVSSYLERVAQAKLVISTALPDFVSLVAYFSFDVKFRSAASVPS